MSTQTLEQFLFWCMVINLGLMFISLALVTVLRPMVLRIHSRMFRVPEDYVAMAMHAFLSLYKLLAFFFVIIPWIALKIIAE
jgi:hypothetical protein